MGNKRKIKLIVIILLFLVTGGFAYRNTEPVTFEEKPSLQQHFAHIEGYEAIRTVGLEENIIKMLDLDDCTFVDYKAVVSG